MKKYRGGFFQTEPYQRDQIRYQEIYIVIQLFHNGPVMISIPSWKYYQVCKEDDSVSQ